MVACPPPLVAPLPKPILVGCILVDCAPWFGRFAVDRGAHWLEQQQMQASKPSASHWKPDMTWRTTPVPGQQSVWQTSNLQREFGPLAHAALGQNSKTSIKEIWPKLLHCKRKDNPAGTGVYLLRTRLFLCLLISDLHSGNAR